ncbi:MAG: aminotransferase class V-fold PLP-dependent enzyme [Candidatus Brocadiae bacterium]|nr:aminotransferase class V-fold PLP-dependent enzyme [Candidatus Brocadiia bacterium]
MKTVYLDNNATTRLRPEALQAMMPFLTDLYGNPSSLHAFGSQVGRALDTAREQVGALLGVRSQDIVFTGTGTEANNMALKGYAEANPGRKHIVTTPVEHPCVREVCAWLGERGYEVTEVPVAADGTLSPDAWRAALRKETAFATAMAANNETGVIFPYEELAAACAEKGVPFHCDGVQAAGKIPVRLAESAVSSMTVAAHKFGGPKGVGALYVRRNARLKPLLHGGHQEKGRRAGTENVAGIAGMGAAADAALRDLPLEESRVRPLRDRFEAAILGRIPGAIRNGHPDQRVPNTSNLGFSDVEGEAVLLILSQFGVCVSIGSACSSGSTEPSHVLRAMGVPKSHIFGSLRFSLGLDTTPEEIDYASARTAEAVAKLRKVAGKEAVRR